MPNKYFAYFLHVEPCNLVFLKIYKTDVDESIIKFTDQNGTSLEIEDKIDLTFLVNN